MWTWTWTGQTHFMVGPGRGPTKKLGNEYNLRESLKNAKRCPMDEGGGVIFDQFLML